MIKLKRLSSSPILEPISGHKWEAAAVFNTAAIKYDGKVHLVYRATDITSNGQQGRYINSLGYAVSSDGIHFKRHDEPIMVNDVPQEQRGPEDPRIVELDGRFYMMYTGYGGRFDGDYRICLASSQNLINWERHGVMLDEPNKDASLFPEKIGGRYAMIHRRSPDIWLAYSNDLQNWSDHQRLLSPIGDSRWESVKIGLAGPPLRIGKNWLMIYHGVGGDPRAYSLGLAFLDGTDPTRVINRQKEPILEPELDWEVNGFVPRVVFSCGQVEMDDQLYVYYGGADQVIGVAEVSLAEINLIGENL
jgi:predicted GH43/DUF377 family glycosyl hydrolase